LDALGGAVAAWPLAAHAQSGSVRRIGVLMNGAATEAARQSWVAAFNQTLLGLGWVESQNIRVDVRWNAGDAQLARIYAAQLIGLMPDVILASSTINLRVIQQATNIPGLRRLAILGNVGNPFPCWSWARSKRRPASLTRERMPFTTMWQCFAGSPAQ